MKASAVGPSDLRRPVRPGRGVRPVGRGSGCGAAGWGRWREGALALLMAMTVPPYGLG